MAEGQDPIESRGIFVGGRTWALLNAMAYFDNERNRGRGRAGRAPPIRTFSNNRETRQEVHPPHGRAHALVPGVGGLSSWRGRGRALSLLTSSTPPSTPQPDQQ